MKNIARRALCVGMAGLLVACTATYTSPGLTTTEPGQVAVLSAPSGALGLGNVRLMAVDGDPTGSKIVTTALLKPGRHRLRLELEKGNARAAPMFLEIDAKAGARYALKQEITETGRGMATPHGFSGVSGNWIAWIVDEASGQTVSRRVK